MAHPLFIRSGKFIYSMGGFFLAPAKIFAKMCLTQSIKVKQYAELQLLLSMLRSCELFSVPVVCFDLMEVVPVCGHYMFDCRDGDSNFQTLMY